MKTPDSISAFLHFFNDFIGMVAPGLIFLFGLGLIQEYDLESWKQKIAPYDGFVWLIAIIVSYAVGHVLLSIHSVFSEWIKKMGGESFTALSSGSYIAFKKVTQKKLTEKTLTEQKLTDNDIRNIAMSISAEASELGRRFRFISLFCNGIATSLLALTLCSFVFHPHNSGSIWAVRIVLTIVAAFLFHRGIEFEKRAYKVPFPVALSTILFEEKKSDN